MIGIIKINKKIKIKINNNKMIGMINKNNNKNNRKIINIININNKNKIHIKN
jgi:hypothetical protein